MNAPLELRLRKDKKTLAIAFSAQQLYTLSAELLRVESPSAEVQGHGADEKRLVAGKADVEITDITPVGHYAVRLTFSDGHKTGLYTWDYLKELAEKQDALIAAYDQQLESRGLSRHA